MGGTTSRGYRYPFGNEADQVPVDLRNLATDVNNDIAALITACKLGDSGHQTSGISITFANGWGGGITQDWRIRNGAMFLTLTASRGNGTAVLTGPSNGNLSPNNLVLTMNDHQPERNQWGSYGAVGAGGECLLDPNGNLYLVSLASTATIGPGDTIRATFTYPV